MIDLQTKGYSLSRSPVEMSKAVESLLATNDKPFMLYFAPDDPHRLGERPTSGPNSFGNRPDGYPGVRTVTYDPAKVMVPSFLPDRPETRAELAQYYQSVSRLDQGVGALVAAAGVLQT